MKKNIIKGLAFLALPALLFGACKKVDITDGVVEVFNVSSSKASVSFQFVDANTGQLLDMNGNEDIQIRIGGANAQDVSDNFGAQKYGADLGLLSLSIAESLIPSENTPVEFTVHATANGYFPSSTDVTLIEEGHTHISVSMVSVNNAPQDIKVATDLIAGVGSTGEISSDFSLMPAVSNSGTTAEVNISTGTKLMDKNGNAVSGNIDVELAYVDPNGENASLVLPGDLNRAQMDNGDFMTFNTLGAVAMDMYAGTKEVTNFDTPIQMTISIPNGATKFDGSAIAAGDDFGVYSYDEENSNWKLESTETVSMNTTSGLLEVTFDMAHLSAWQVAEGEKTSSGYDYNMVTFNSNCQDYYLNTSEIIWEYVEESGSVSHRQTASFQFGSPMKIVSVISAKANYANNVTYKWYKKGNPSDFITAPATYQANPTVNLPDAWCVAENTPFKILLSTSCPDNPNRIYKPNCFVFAFEEGKFNEFGEWKILGQMKGGEIETSTGVLEKGKEYTIGCIYQDKLVFLTGTLDNFDLGKVLVDGNDIDLSRPLTNAECSYLKG